MLRATAVAPLATLGFAAVAVLVLMALPEAHPLRVRNDLMPTWLHTAMEFASVSVCLSMFAVAWHVPRPGHANSITVLGCGFLAVALLDTAHALSYAGMPDFVTPSSPQKAISFWLVARYVQGLALLYVTLVPWRPFRREETRFLVLGTTMALTALACVVLLGPLAHELPELFVAGSGLTPTKIALEAIAIGITAVATVRLHRMAKATGMFDPAGIAAAGGLLVIASAALAMYSDVNDAFSLVGHACKVAGFYVAYRVVFVPTVRYPQERLEKETAARETAQRHAWRLQYTDPLTGLPNRARLNERLAAAYGEARGAGSAPGFALVMVDIDGFSTLNDLHGHGLGDAVLRVVAERIAEAGNPPREAFRLAGDEFAVLLDQVDDEAAACSVALRLGAAVGDPIRLFGMEFSLTAGMGIALASRAPSAEALARNAGTALHQAKAYGPGSCRVHEPAMDEAISQRESLRSDLRRALERGEMRVHFQPQVRLADGRVAGAEALVRWQHPTRGEVAPSRFITDAEETGLIVDLGGWVLEEACRQAAAWRAHGLALETVAVNFSARQFQDPAVVARIEAALWRSGLPPGVLEIELTESVLIHDTEAMLAALRAVKALGVRIAVDDFGTGYSSLAYLHAFPIDKLKIDQSFVRGLGRRADSQVVVRAVVQLAGALDLEPVAEGVEDEASAAMLAGMGCSQAQGYLYARPMAPAEFLAWARDRAAEAVPA